LPRQPTIVIAGYDYRFAYSKLLFGVGRDGDSTMKCCHLVAALLLAACGLDSAAVPPRSSPDAGVTEPRGPVAGEPANFPTRRLPPAIRKDAGSDDTDPAKPQAGGSGAPKPNDPSSNPTQGAKDGGSSSSPGSGGPTNPSTQSPGKGNPSAQGDGGQSSPGGANSGGDAGASGTSGGAPRDAGSDNGSGQPDDDGDDGDDDDDDGDPNGNGNGSQNPPSNGGSGGYDTIDAIVDLVLAILDLSLGPIRGAEIEQLVSAILVLSLAPADLAVDSLIAVLDALDQTRICVDHPERCNPLCTNLESDCSACGRDEECIERIEEMCKVRLPRSCH
jgi:hypothetical protein